jgi:hypothetical protein
MADRSGFGLLAFPVTILLAGMIVFASSGIPGKKKTDETFSPEDVLLCIYHEVVELGFRENEVFLKREFHFDLDGREENREEHIVVLCHPYYSYTKFILQVTYFEEGVRIGSGRSALEFKEVCGLIKNGQLEISRNSYSPEEAGTLFPAILAGIKAEKKLFELIKREARGPASLESNPHVKK